MFYNTIINDHLPWLNDAGRNTFYKRIIQETCNGKTCVDVGAGTGILTDYALESGAKKVYCVEIRKSRAQFLKEKYKNKNVEILEEDFLKTDIKDGDVFFIEQIGCQFNNNFSIKSFMSHIGKAETIPNRYLLKAYAYDGIVNDHPKFLIDSETLPKGFFEQSQKNLRIKPTEVLNVYEINKHTADKDIEFTLDLSHYKDCTIFLDDEVYYNDQRCEYENTYRDWPQKPYRIQITDARRPIQFRWMGNEFIYS